MTLTYLTYEVTGSKRKAHGVATGPASYTTGGESFPPEDLKMNTLDVVLFGIASDGGTNIRWVTYDKTNEKALWYSALDTQIADTTDLSSYTVQFWAIGN